MVGHLKKQYPYPRFSKSAQKAPGKRYLSTQKNTSIAKLTVPSKSEQDIGKQKVEELQHALCEAQLSVALEEYTATIHGVVPAEKRSTKLGPMYGYYSSYSE